MQEPYYQDNSVTIYHGDCLDVMPGIADKSVDMVLADPPYGTTACKWDSIIPLEPMWEQLKRIIKPNGAIAMTASQPFTTTLIASNIKIFRYALVWKKTRKTGFQMARLRPMKEHEDIIVFYSKQPTYNQNLVRLKKPVMSWRKNGKGGSLLNPVDTHKGRMQEWTGFNTDIIEIASVHNVGVHPTQKPVALMEHLINIYTNKGEMVLDFAAGSGTTGRAAKNLGRKAVLIEIEEQYCEVAANRMRQEVLI